MNIDSDQSTFTYPNMKSKWVIINTDNIAPYIEILSLFFLFK
jgi:hypothetical protein